MKIVQIRRAAAVLLLACAGVQVLAAGVLAPETFRLTSALLDRMQAVQIEAEGMGKGAAAEADGDAGTAQEMARALEADPRIRALLAKHRISSADYAQGAFAVLHAGLFVAMSANSTAQQQAAALRTFTPTQRANIELMRQRLK